jgi:hypothetical protein
VSKGGITAQTGVVEPKRLEFRLKLHAQVMGPGLVLGQVEAFGGTAAHRNDGEIPEKIRRRFRAPEPQRIPLMNDHLIQFSQTMFMVDNFFFINRQDNSITFDPEAQGIINSQDYFTET